MDWHTRHWLARFVDTLEGNGIDGETAAILLTGLLGEEVTPPPPDDTGTPLGGPPVDG
jgi:hypothetical protein